MSIIKKSLKVLLLGTTLMTSAKAADVTFAASDYRNIYDTFAVPVSGLAETDKAVEISAVAGASINKGYLGTVAASNESYVYESSGILKVLAIIGGKWCTFASADLSAGVSATGLIHLTQTTEDGVANTTKKLTISLTKGTGASNLTTAQLLTFLQANFTTANKSFSASGSASGLKTLSTSLPTGWTASALFQVAAKTTAVAADALAATLDPIAFTLTAPITLATGGSAVDFTYALPDISSYNVVATSGSVVGGADSVVLTNSTSTLTLKLKPEKITSHATSIMVGLVAGANALTRRILSTSTPYTFKDSSAIMTAVTTEHGRLATDPTNDPTTDTIKETVDVILGKISSTASNVQTDLATQHARLATDPTAVATDTIKETVDVILALIGGGATNVQTGVKGLVDMLAETYISSANFVKAEGTAVATNYSFVVLGSNLDLNNNSWSNNGSKVIVTSGSGATLKTYSFDVQSLSSMVFKTTVNPVLKFSTAAGDVFWIKSFDGTGIDKSAYANVDFRDDQLAIAIAEVFYSTSGTTTINGKTLTQLSTAASS